MTETVPFRTRPCPLYSLSIKALCNERSRVLGSFYLFEGLDNNSQYRHLIRTLHILRWYHDQDGRRRINRQLNKGEAIHSLRSAIRVANQGELRRKQEEALTS
jgi:hypothetical protein